MRRGASDSAAGGEDHKTVKSGYKLNGPRKGPSQLALEDGTGPQKTTRFHVKVGRAGPTRASHAVR